MRSSLIALGVLAAFAAISPARAGSNDLSAVGSAAVRGRAVAQTKLQAATLPAGWHRHAPPGAGYLVAFPAAPEFQEVTERVGGATIRVRVANFGGEDGDGLSFTVADEQYSFRQSLDQVEAMLDAYQAAYVEGYGAHLLGQGSLNINGRPGRELILDLDGYAMVYVRVIVSPNQVIVLTAVVPTGTEETGEVGRFFESFQLVEVN